MLDFIKFKRVLVIHGNFNIFAEEAHILLSEVLLLVIVLFLEQLLLELVGANPREKLQLEFATLVYHVLEVKLYLLDYAVRVGLQVAELRVHHYYNYFTQGSK